MSSTLPQQPAVAIRIGVTGSRVLPDFQLARIRDDINSFLTQIRDHAATIAKDPRAANVYADNPPSLLVVSALAEGADRMVAQCGIDCGYALRSILPFERERYKNDFTTQASCTEFDRLLADCSAGIVELDGDHDAYKPDSYEAAGHLIVRTVDLLIAVWDGRPGQRGGTEPTVRHAVSQGVPVWWIHATEAKRSCFITGTYQLRDRASITDEMGATIRYLDRLLYPPPIGDDVAYDILEHIRRIANRLHPPPADAYLRSNAPRQRCYWQASEWLIRIAARTPQPPGANATFKGGYWHDRLLTADLRANGYGNRVRSGYVWVSVLTALSVALASISSLLHDYHAIERIATLTEIVALAMITGLLIGRQWLDWHQRWRDLRRLAEALRSKLVLAPLAEEVAGWIRTASASDSQVPVGRSYWVDWIVTAYVRAAPTSNVCINQESLQTVRDSIAGIFADQRAWHLHKARESVHADSKARMFDQLSFPIVIVLVGVKLYSSLQGWEPVVADLLAWFATVLPVLALNIASIRASFHLQVQAHKSEAMASEFGLALSRLMSVDLGRPLASQEISIVARAMAARMTNDTDSRLEVISGD